jgi:hypothetical protein
VKLRITFHPQCAVQAPGHWVMQALAEPVGQSSATPQFQLSRANLSILRLLGALGERKSPFGNFDEKGFIRRSTSFLRQSNALSSVVA